MKYTPEFRRRVLDLVKAASPWRRWPSTWA